MTIVQAVLIDLIQTVCDGDKDNKYRTIGVGLIQEDYDKHLASFDEF